jgi:hypothetical protein
MSWLPLLLAAWIVPDVVVVAAYVAMHRHRANIRELNGTRRPSAGLSQGATRRLVH